MASLPILAALTRRPSGAHAAPHANRFRHGHRSQFVGGVGSAWRCVFLQSCAAANVRTRGRTSIGRGLARAMAGEETGDGVQDSVAAGESKPGESKLGAAKGFGASSRTLAADKKKSSKSSSSSVRRSPPSKPLIGAPAISTQTQQIETAVVVSLAFLFGVILLEGLALATSGFLPEEWDQFATNWVYPAFTPSVGVFLAMAASFGLWKYFGGGTQPSNK